MDLGRVLRDFRIRTLHSELHDLRLPESDLSCAQLDCLQLKRTEELLASKTWIFNSVTLAKGMAVIGVRLQVIATG